ncbi:MAG: LPS assembly protein LptD [Candidatus Competibacteraceae bacterium]
MTPYYRLLVTSAVLALLPLASTQAQTTDDATRWAQCETDELAQGIIPASLNAPLNELPIQGEASRAESSATTSLLEGNVSLSRGDQRLHAERITLERPTNLARSEGDFTYGDPQFSLRGKQAEVNLSEGTGWFKDIDYYLPSRNAQGSAAEVQVNRAKQQSRMKDATYSTCQRGKEVWQLRADKLNLNEATGYGTARDLVLAFKDVPVFYFPYLSFPLDDQRHSGFLFPRQGYASGTGWDLQVPYYWNIAPNRDMTITPRFMSARGLLLGVEYRFLSPKDQGQIGFEYIPDDRRYDGARGSFNATDRAAPLPNLYTDLHYEYVSDDNYIQDLSNNLSFLSTNYLERHLDVRYYGDWWQALARVQGFQVLNPSQFALTGNPYERLPQLLFSGAWPPSASGLNYQIYGEMVRFYQPDAVTGTRLDLWPSIGWSLEKPWGYLKPEAGVRYTTYQLDNTAPGTNNAPSRTAPILSLDSGLIFERPLNANWLGVSSGTQTLEPRLFYLYVPYRDQSDIPLFDTSLLNGDYDWLFRKNRFSGADRLGDANQVTAALTTRLIDGPSGAERLRASVGQIQYFEDRQVTLDPAAPPETSATSGLIAQGLLNLSSRWSVQGNIQLEPDSHNVLRTATNLRYAANPRELVNVAYLLDRNQPGLDLSDQIHAVDVSLIWPLTSQVHVIGRWNKALNLDRNLETLAGLEYEDCCWALRAVARQYRSSPVDVDTQTAFYMELELKGLSRVGGGNLESVLRNSILGYQTIH